MTGNIAKTTKIPKGYLEIDNKKYPLFEGVNTIGRNLKAVIKLGYQDISISHAIITILDKNLQYLSDLNSCNGTFLNGTKLNPLDLYELKGGETLRFGNISTIFSIIPPNGETDINLNNSHNESQTLDNNIFGAATQQLEIDVHNLPTQLFDNDQQLNSSNISTNNERGFNDLSTQIMDNFHELPTQIFDTPENQNESISNNDKNSDDSIDFAKIDTQKIIDESFMKEASKLDDVSKNVDETSESVPSTSTKNTSISVDIHDLPTQVNINNEGSNDSIDFSKVDTQQIRSEAEELSQVKGVKSTRKNPLDSDETSNSPRPSTSHLEIVDDLPSQVCENIEITTEVVNQDENSNDSVDFLKIETQKIESSDQLTQVVGVRLNKQNLFESDPEEVEDLPIRTDAIPSASAEELLPTDDIPTQVTEKIDETIEINDESSNESLVLGQSKVQDKQDSDSDSDIELVKQKRPIFSLSTTKRKSKYQLLSSDDETDVDETFNESDCIPATQAITNRKSVIQDSFQDSFNLKLSEPLMINEIGKDIITEVVDKVSDDKIATADTNESKETPEKSTAKNEDDADLFYKPTQPSSSTAVVEIEDDDIFNQVTQRTSDADNVLPTSTPISKNTRMLNTQEEIFGKDITSPDNVGNKLLEHLFSIPGSPVRRQKLNTSKAPDELEDNLQMIFASQRDTIDCTQQLVNILENSFDENKEEEQVTKEKEAAVSKEIEDKNTKSKESEVSGVERETTEIDENNKKNIRGSRSMAKNKQSEEEEIIKEKRSSRLTRSRKPNSSNETDSEDKEKNKETEEHEKNKQSEEEEEKTIKEKRSSRLTKSRKPNSSNETDSVDKEKNNETEELEKNKRSSRQTKNKKVKPNQSENSTEEEIQQNDDNKKDSDQSEKVENIRSSRSTKNQNSKSDSSKNDEDSKKDSEQSESSEGTKRSNRQTRNKSRKTEEDKIVENDENDKDSERSENSEETKRSSRQRRNQKSNQAEKEEGVENKKESQDLEKNDNHERTKRSNRQTRNRNVRSKESENSTEEKVGHQNEDNNKDSQQSESSESSRRSSRQTTSKKQTNQSENKEIKDSEQLEKEEMKRSNRLTKTGKELAIDKNQPEESNNKIEQESTKKSQNKQEPMTRKERTRRSSAVQNPKESSEETTDTEQKNVEIVEKRQSRQIRNKKQINKTKSEIDDENKSEVDNEEKPTNVVKNKTRETRKRSVSTEDQAPISSKLKKTDDNERKSSNRKKLFKIDENADEQLGVVQNESVEESSPPKLSKRSRNSKDDSATTSRNKKIRTSEIKKPKEDLNSEDEFEEIQVTSNSSFSSPERSRRKLKPKVVFTMMDDPGLESIIRQLGGMVVDTVDACTVLVTGSVKRSCKLLTAIGQGKPICSPKWLLDSKKNFKFLEPTDYILVDKEAEKKWDFSLEESLKRSSTKRLFADYTFYILVQQAADVLKGAIESCGGKCITRINNKTIPENLIIVASPENKQKYKKIVDSHSNVKVVEPEAIFDGTLRQEIRFERHLLK